MWTTRLPSAKNNPWMSPVQWRGMRKHVRGRGSPVCQSRRSRDDGHKRASNTLRATSCLVFTNTIVYTLPDSGEPASEKKSTSDRTHTKPQPGNPALGARLAVLAAAAWRAPPVQYLLGCSSTRFRSTHTAGQTPRQQTSFPQTHSRRVCLPTPFHPRPWQELEVCFFAGRFEQQAAGEVVDIPVSTWQRAPLASPAACPTTAP